MAKRGAVGPAAITLIVIDALLIVALVVIMVTWPDTSGTEDEPSPSASVSEAAGGSGEGEETTAAAGGSGEGEETTEADAVEVPEGARDLAGFAMPSGNIWCELQDADTQCVIESFTYSPPSIEDCSEDVAGHVWQVTAEEAGPACPGDQVPEPSQELSELDYGEATTVGDFLCESTEEGVTCRAISTGHGFEIARDGTRSF